MSKLSSRIREIRQQFGYSQKEFAKKLGIGWQTLVRYERGDREIPSGVIEKLIQMGINPKWLFLGEGKMFLGESEEGVSIAPFDSENYSLIPLVSGKVSAGPGLIPDERVEYYIAFKRTFITRFGDPEFMSLIRVEGDSMKPTLDSGDLVLVDHSRNYIDPNGGIYAISLDEHILIKRLQLTPDRKILIISDNPVYENFKVSPDELTINGRVILAIRKLI